MATVIEPPQSVETSAQEPTPVRKTDRSTLERLLGPLASLKLTVVLLAACEFIVLAGTFAQTRTDIWEVIDSYFRFDVARVFVGGFPFVDPSALFVWIDAALFFPPAFAPNGPPAWATQSWAGFPFPKGWTLGVLLLINLVAAHSIRFKIQAKGSRLTFGLVASAVGILFTYMVVAAGGNNDGFQTDTWVSYDAVWTGVVLSLAMIGCACGWGFVTMDRKRSEERWLVLFGGLGSVVLFLYLLAAGSDARLDDAYMRIMWQLIKATVAGLVLLVGCVLLFKKRAGIVLLHGGVSLMMIGEILVGLQATESKMTIQEGRASNFSADTRDWEFAIIDPDPIDAAGEMIETVISSDVVGASPEKQVVLSELPFDLHVRGFQPNSFVQAATKKEIRDGDVLATSGVGTDAIIRSMDISKGTESTLDMPSAYVDLVDKESGEVVDTLLLSTWLDEQNILVGDKVYQFALRFKRSYKNYTIYLNDMFKEDYIGTSTPRDFSAFVSLADPTTGVRNDDIRIWMNNPLRYAGETFYQADYLSRRGEGTGIQIVTNQGWMIPYVACMIVAVGMVAQFGQSILRFIDRRRRKRLGAVASEDIDEDSESGSGPAPIRSDNPALHARSTGEVLGVALSVMLAGSMMAMKILPPSVDSGEPDLQAAASLPAVKGGRVKPLDTIALNSLLILSDKQTAKRPHPDPEKAADDKMLTVEATQWLLDVITRSEVANEYRVFRIENLEVLEFMELPRRSGLLYSMNELLPVLAPEPDENGIVPASKFDQQTAVLRDLDTEDMTFFQKKLADLYRKLNLYRGLQIAFGEAPFPEVASPREMGEAIRRIQSQISSLTRVIPVTSETALPPSDKGWMSLAEAKLIAEIEKVANEANSGPISIVTLVDAYDAMLLSWAAYAEASRELEEATYGVDTSEELATGIASDAAAAAEQFNAAARQFQSLLLTELSSANASGPAATAVESYHPAKLGFESFFNRFAPFHLAWILYIFAGVLALLSLLFAPREFRSAALATILLTFALHTFALWARIYISGRPPVTNLYSSAIFIGWAAVLFGIGLELIYKMGVGNIIAATAGILTLRIAHVLAADGDTFEVLQAVLDTQFWLATHVVTITLGYSATFVAGLLAAVGVFRSFKRDERTDEDRKTLARMTYGVTCFAMLFSFVGTVLGGLWADDSWGRFWGWDPKENGALMIVLANAIVLHARWGKMIGDRGLFVLAILSNIVVAWSWFGTNELGVGLHSYGFTEGRLQALALFMLSQVVIAAIAFIPRMDAKSEQAA